MNLNALLFSQIKFVQHYFNCLSIQEMIDENITLEKSSKQITKNKSKAKTKRSSSESTIDTGLNGTVN